MNNLKLILGPPGTGKTTRLLAMLRDLFDAGVSPNDVAFVSFTKGAIAEITARLPNFGPNEIKALRW